MNRSEVYRAIESERAYQDAKWGDVEANPHSIDVWLNLITEEVNEVDGALSLDDALGELRQVAAVAIAALEQYGVKQREGYEQPAQRPSVGDE